MGLDNLVTIKNCTRNQLPKCMRYPFDEDYTQNEVDICYWRKCWGLRNEIMNHIGGREAPPEWYEFRLTRDDVLFIWRLIVHYLKEPAHWEDSIWSFDEIKHSLRDQRWNLMILYYWMKLHPDLEVYFIDSY